MRDELEVLLSIYPEVIVKDDSIETDIPVSFDSPRALVFDKLPSFTVDYLPPLNVNVSYNNEYPIDKAPVVQLQCAWLSSDVLVQLQLECQGLWQPGDEVLYAILDHLYSRTDSAFGVESPQGIPVRDELYRVLSTYQDYATAKEFARHSYDCEICLEWKVGTECLQLCSARHVFCRACLQDMFSLHIREGSVDQIRCPSCPGEAETDTTTMTTTTTKHAPVTASKIPLVVLQQIVSPEELDRYVKLVRKKELEALPSSTYCPRDFCATVLARDPDEKLVVCTNCTLAFCADCKRTWHGPTEPCKRLAVDTELGSIYKALREDGNKQAEVMRMERLYGKKTLDRLAREFEDQILLQQWQTSNAQACPACGTFIEKSYGCNHLQCGICSVHFCFLCGDRLSSQNPYSHYSDRGIYCYGKLFHGLMGRDGLDDPLAGIDFD